MPIRWRWLQHGAAHGAFNMGVDEALLASAIEGIATLRLYRWEGPWLSLGYAQQLDPQRVAACEAAGVQIVRRVSGGRAVLHGCDLTYCVAAPEAALPKGLLGSYQLVADALIEGLRSLGVAAVRARRPRPATGATEFDCFAAPAQEEICAIGRKLVGSAQRRVRGGVLQHGSIRLSPDPPEASAAVGFAPGVATSLEELGVRARIDELQEALKAAFRRVLGASVEEAVLSPRELGSAEQRLATYRTALAAGARTPA